MFLWIGRQRHIHTLGRFIMRYLFGREGQRLVQGLRMFYRLRTEVVLQSEQIGRMARRNDVRVWVDGTEAFPRIERLFRRARHSIIIQMFIWKDDSTGQRMATTLLEAADRGVRVEITKEAVGDVFEFQHDFLGTQKSDLPLWKRFWSHPNIDVTYAKHNDHTKVYVIDDHILILAGMNIADEYRYDWHDYLVELHGSHFVRCYLTREPMKQTEGQARIVMNTDTQKDIRNEVMRLLRSAEHSIVVEHCYFSDPEVISLLIRRSHEGIRIIVIVPERQGLHYHANLQSVARLLSEGNTSSMQVLLFPGIVHGKILLIDRDMAFLGSANFMRSSLDDMGEVNVLIQGASRAPLQKLRETLRQDILRSRPMAAAPYLWWTTKVLAWMGL